MDIVEQACKVLGIDTIRVQRGFVVGQEYPREDAALNAIKAKLREKGCSYTGGWARVNLTQLTGPTARPDTELDRELKKLRDELMRKSGLSSCPTCGKPLSNGDEGPVTTASEREAAGPEPRFIDDYPDHDDMAELDAATEEKEEWWNK